MWSLIKRTVLVDMAAIAMLCVCVLGPAVMGHGNNPGDITQAPADECIERCVRVCGAGRICEYEIEVDGSQRLPGGHVADAGGMGCRPGPAVLGRAVRAGRLVLGLARITAPAPVSRQRAPARGLGRRREPFSIMTDPEFLALITSLRERFRYSIDVMKLCDEASLMRGHQARFSEAWQQL
ncbi:MAG: hypothetical protein ACYSUI_24750, partial [Planctomycetota bacterium]